MVKVLQNYNLTSKVQPIVHTKAIIKKNSEG